MENAASVEIRKKRGFPPRYGNVVRLDSEENLVLLVQVVSRANSKPICSGCGCPGTGYDTLEPRIFEFVPLWNIAIFFAYALRRVNCETCGVKIKKVPWADGKNTLTKTYMQSVASLMRGIRDTAQIAILGAQQLRLLVKHYQRRSCSCANTAGSITPTGSGSIY